MRNKEGIPQFKTLEEEKAYWESKGPLGIEAKREEIREGMRKLSTIRPEGCIYERCLQYKDDCASCRVDEVWEYLHSVDVVIEVDRELPPIPRKDIVHIIMERDRVLLKAGYVAVKPLIGAPQ